jgi:hypothetical protein
MILYTLFKLYATIRLGYGQEGLYVFATANAGRRHGSCKEPLR